MPLKSGEVKCVGDPVAVVIGTDRYGVVDAAEQVFVEYEPKARRRPIPRPRSRRAPPWSGISSAPTAPTSGRSAAATSTAGLAEAEFVLEQRIVNHRIAGAPIETRGIIAEPQGEKTTLYSSTQIPHITRFMLSGVLGTSEDNLRVVAPDVGGGFGGEAQHVPRGGRAVRGSAAARPADQVDRDALGEPVRSTTTAATRSPT